MIKQKLLLIFGLLWASSCIHGGFRHYSAIANCLPVTEEKDGKAWTWFTCHDADGRPFEVRPGDKAMQDLVAFKKSEWATHEQECHAK